MTSLIHKSAIQNHHCETYNCTRTPQLTTLIRNNTKNPIDSVSKTFTNMYNRYTHSIPSAHTDTPNSTHTIEREFIECAYNCCCFFLLYFVLVILHPRAQSKRFAHQQCACVLSHRHESFYLAESLFLSPSVTRSSSIYNVVV